MNTIETAPWIRNRWPDFVLAAVLPLAVAACSYALWWISDRLLYIGPLDRAAFGWAVVIPVWIAAPTVGGLAWGRLDRRASLGVAALVALVVGALAAWMLWQASAFPDCQFGATRTPPEMAPPSLLFGAVVGGGLALSGLVSAKFAREGRLIAALVLGAAAEALMVAAAILVVGLMLVGPSCQRPSV
jgi:hypothetical protein